MSNTGAAQGCAASVSHFSGQMPLHKVTIAGCFTAGLLTLAALVQACASSKEAPAAGCETDPNQCPAGTTCWPKECLCPTGQVCDLSNCRPSMACVASASGKSPHQPCKNTVGTPSCSDRQACVEFVEGRGGCLVYCDDTKPNRGCGQIESCVDVGVGNVPNAPVIHVCAVVEDGGPPESDSGGGALDAAPRDARSELPN